MSGAGTVSIFWFLLCLFLVMAFAWTRPLTLRDFENRKLAGNVSAQVFFTLLYAVLFVVLVAAYHFGGRAVLNFARGVAWMNFADHWLQTNAGFAPLLALTTLGWFQSLPQLREVERTCLVYTYSARYMFSDVKELADYFQGCDYVPTEAERAKNRKVLERLQVFLTDKNTETIELKVVSDWRKVETLLRHLDQWTAERGSVLNEEELAHLKEARIAHERKTQLAANIIRMLDHVASGKGPAETLSEVTDLLSSASHADRPRVAAVEAELSGMLEGDAPGTAPVFLSSTQFRGFLQQIQHYFEEEYRILSRQVAELAAKTIVHSGDVAPARLAAIKTAGFTGLGSIQPISFNRILWVFFAVLAIGFLLFFFRHLLTLKQGLADATGATGGFKGRGAERIVMLLATISLTMALATIVGAAVGSTRRLAQRATTPWRAYIMAGLVATVMFFVAHGARTMLAQSIEEAETTRVEQSQRQAGAMQRPAASAQQTAGELAKPGTAARPYGMLQAVPWAIVPFLVTIGLCLLARVPAWPTPVRLRGSALHTALWERAVDGAALAALMIVSQAIVIRVMFPLLGQQLPPQIQAAMEKAVLPFPILWPQVLLGIFIGALVLRDMRLAAHSRVVLAPCPPLRPTAAPVHSTAQLAHG